MYLVGKIIGTPGIKGEVKVKADTSFNRFETNNILYLKKNDQMIEIKINSHRKHKNHDLITFNNYKNINDVLEGLLKTLKDEILKLNDNIQIEKYARCLLEQIKSNNDFINEQYLLKEIKNLKDFKDEDAQKRVSHFKTEKKKYMQKNYPLNLKSGDIVYVKYGIGIADEIQDGHYSIILSQNGSMFLVAPLTSKPQKFDENNLYFENLGLPSKLVCEEEKSYVSFTQIRYVHCRRIENIENIKGGRLHIDETKVDKILENYFNIITIGRINQ